MNQHIPVLVKELLDGLDIVPGGHYLDATLGYGGHTGLILAIFPDIEVTAIDRDPIAISCATQNLQEYLNSRLHVWQGNFADFTPKIAGFNGIIADLGVSSPQLDNPERGFSFRHSAPLDMRMDTTQSLTAAQIINHWEEKALADIFYQYGEERLSRPLARKIVQKRPFTTTVALAEAISSSVPSKYRYGRIHPATRIFQALRIVVNQELSSLETLLKLAPEWLIPGGKIGIISFHSLEDRIVKYAFRDNPELQVITKKPVIASSEECSSNPRSRSAKLRFAQKI